MKSPISRQDKQRPRPTPLATSIPEVALITAYFLAVWLIPISWLDTPVGVIAFSIAGKVNPYLSEFSIAFSAEPQYFIHCHVLATWMLPTLLPYLIINRNGGRDHYANTWREIHEKWGGWVPHLLFSTAIFGLLYFSMVWLVDYPLKRGEWAIWIGGIAPSALVIQSTLGIGVMVIYMSIFSALSKGSGNNELR